MLKLPTLYVVHIDTDAEYRAVVAKELHDCPYPKFQVFQYQSFEEFKANPPQQLPSVLIYDLDKPSPLDPSLFQELLYALKGLPIILVTVPTGDKEIDVDAVVNVIASGVDNIFSKTKFPADMWPQFIARSVARSVSTRKVQGGLGEVYGAIHRLSEGIKAFAETGKK